MKLTKQEIAVIRLLISTDDYISSYDISASSGISRRMVREIMPRLRDTLEEAGIELDSKTNKGYRLAMLNTENRARLREMIAEGEKAVSQVPEDLINRHNYIMRRLIEADGYMLVDKLADEMMLSRTVVSSLLKTVRQKIRKYNLTMEQRPYYGLRINGNEIDKRHALNDFNFKAFSDTAMYYDFLDSLAADENQWERRVLEIFRRHDILFTDVALVDLLVCIAVQTGRISSGHELQDYVMDDVKEDSLEMAVAREIALAIKEQQFCEMNEYEIRVMAVAIACKRSPVHMKVDDHDADPVTERIFAAIKKKTSVDFVAADPDGMIVRTVRHVMRQLRSHEKIRTEMWNTVYALYPLAYYHAMVAEKILSEETGAKLGDSHRVYLTQAFQTVMRQTVKKPLRILFICGHTDVGRRFLRQSLESRLAPYAEVAKTIQYYQLYEEDTAGYDLIVSTISIHRQMPIPYICISQDVNEDDLNAAEQFIHSRFTLCIPEFHFHPALFVHCSDEPDLKEIRRIIGRCVSEVYGETTMNFARLSEKDLNTDLFNGVMLAETIREVSCPCPWCVLVPDSPFRWGKQEIQAVILYFGKKDSWDYNDVRRMIATRLVAEKPAAITKALTSLPSFLTWLNRK